MIALVTRLRPGTSAALALLLSAAIVSGQAPARQSGPADKGLFWEFGREGRSGWLVGSIHQLTADFYPLPPAITAAFEQADTLVEEVDLAEASNPASAMAMLSKAMYPAGTTLSSQLSPETNKALTAWLARNGQSAAAFEQFKPWMVSVTLLSLALQRLGLDPAHGIDRHFADAAARTGKRLVALETAAEQIGFLDGLSPRTQDLMLRDTVENLDAGLAEVKVLLGAWRTGDVSVVERVTLESLQDAPDVYQSVFAERNRRWIPRIESCVETWRCFVVVGAGHMAGPDGLVALLRQRGYRVEQR